MSQKFVAEVRHPRLGKQQKVFVSKNEVFVWAKSNNYTVVTIKPVLMKDCVRK